MSLLRALTVVSLAVCVSACDDDTGNNNMTEDMAVAVQHDLSVAADSCAAALGCISQCTAANLTSCVPACTSKLSSSAQGFFLSFGNCTQTACTGLDAGVTCEIPLRPPA